MPAWVPFGIAAALILLAAAWYFIGPAVRHRPTTRPTTRPRTGGPAH
jgi:hypothetical protein